MKNLFCYVEEKDISEELKASEMNPLCNQCEYFSFCKKDVAEGKEKAVAEKESVKSTEETKTESKTEPIKKEKPVKKEKVEKEAKPKKEKSKVATKKPKKPSIEDLAEMDDIF